MKSKLALRRIAAPDYERQHAVARWQRDGHPVRLCQPHPQTRYISFWAQGSQGLWQGMVDAREWLHAVWPQWQQLLPTGCCDRDILDLLSAVERPIEIQSGLLDYHHLFDFELTHGESLQRALLPCIATAQGTLWVMGLPSYRKVAPRPLQPWLQAVPQVLRVVLGTSDSAPLQSRRLAPGDVLSIAEQTRQLFLADRCIGHFTFIEEGIHMQLTPPDSASLNSADVLPQLPVKLEFVLSELTLSVAQLNEVIERQVLPLEPATANHIEIRAGGKAIAVGELVQLDDRLGVELREVYRSIGDG